MTPSQSLPFIFILEIKNCLVIKNIINIEILVKGLWEIFMCVKMWNTKERKSGLGVNRFSDFTLFGLGLGRNEVTVINRPNWNWFGRFLAVNAECSVRRGMDQWGNVRLRVTTGLTVTSHFEPNPTEYEVKRRHSTYTGRDDVVSGCTKSQMRLGYRVCSLSHLHSDSHLLPKKNPNRARYLYHNCPINDIANHHHQLHYRN